MATSSGGWLGDEHLCCWLTTANRLSELAGVVLGTLTDVVTRLTTLEASYHVGAWSSIGSRATISLGRYVLLIWTRRLKGWPRGIPGWHSSIWNPYPALLRSRAG